MTTFIDIHVLQTVPSSNINRDDTGSPKTAVFGGVRRARVSSQAWKRATRRDFAAYLPADDRGIRTRRLVADLVPRITGRDASISSDDAVALAQTVLTAAIPKLKLEQPRAKKGAAAEAGETAESHPLNAYLIFLSNQQLDRLAELAVTSQGGAIDKAAARAAIKDGNGIEVALFGRMVADDTSINVDAAVQVAHAVSTHAVETEYDYFTAVDDAKDKSTDEDAGAGMIGVVEFNSSTLYRYATVNLDQLYANVGGDPLVATRAVEAFLRSFVMSMPTGKQNTFANNTLPDAVLVQVRDRRPVNLVGAFEDPVQTKPGVAISVQSTEALARAVREIDNAYGFAPISFHLAARSDIAGQLEGLGKRMGLEELVEAVGAQARATLGDQA